MPAVPSPSERKARTGANFQKERTYDKRDGVQVLVLIFLCAAALPLVLTGITYGGRWWVVRRRSDCEEPLPLPARIAAFAEESLALAATMVSLPFGRSKAERVSSACGDNRVILVPGLFFSAAAFSLLARRLRRQGWQPLILRLPLWRLDIAAAAAALDGYIRALPSKPPTTLIAFGAGGLVARDYLRRHPDTGIRRLITLGTAHQGTETPLCRVLRLHQLRPDADSLRRLNENDPIPQRLEVIAIYSEYDALVVPAARAYYGGAFNIEVRGVGHFALARSRRVWELIAENLAPKRQGSNHL